MAASLSALDAAIDQEVTRLEARIDDLRAARREFQRLDECLQEIIPDPSSGPDPDAGAATSTSADRSSVADD